MGHLQEEEDRYQILLGHELHISLMETSVLSVNCPYMLQKM